MSTSKIVLLGATNVGKTAIFRRMSENLFKDVKSATVQGASVPIAFEHDGEIHNFVLHDTAGQEQFRSMTMQYLRTANIGLLVFSITAIESLKESEKWAQDAQSQSPDISLIFIGNKSDLKDNREVTYEEAFNIAKNIGASYIETSAVTGDGFGELHSDLANELKVLKQRKPTMNAPVVALEGDERKNDKTCSC
jgi:small GTP-binding protein